MQVQEHKDLRIQTQKRRPTTEGNEVKNKISTIGIEFNMSFSEANKLSRAKI